MSDNPRLKRIRERISESPIEEMVARQLEGFGVSFRQQEPIGKYFADFYLPDVKTVIECDGKQHALNGEYDQKRDEYMRAQGYKVIRVRGSDIYRDARLMVWEIIKEIWGSLPSFSNGISVFDMPENISDEEKPFVDTPENWDRALGLKTDDFEVNVEEN